MLRVCGGENIERRGIFDLLRENRMSEAYAVPIDVGRSRPRVTHEPAPLDLDKAERAATEMLAALGLPIDSADMFETPRRLVHAYAEMLTPPEFDSTTFENAAGYDELVVVSDIPVRSLCEHHLLPFTGRAHVAYRPQHGKVVGLSKLARTVEVLARRPQVHSKRVPACSSGFA